jgi:hypothetical protein
MAQAAHGGRARARDVSSGRALISLPEIAELAGVQRPVVTTWRRRHAGFPAPAEDSTDAPLFDAREIAEWLVATGRADQEQIGPDLSLYTLAAIDVGLPGRELIAVVTALICVRWLDDDPLAGAGVPALQARADRLDPADRLLLSEVRQLPAGAGWLAQAVDELIEAAWGCRGAFERLMSTRNRFQAADLYTDALRPELARLMAALSGAELRSRLASPAAGPLTIADPAAGSGDLLAAVAAMVGADDPPRCLGAEASPYLARLARRWLLVHDIPLADLDIRIGPELPDEAGSPDLIITQIRYQPQEDRSADAVIDAVGDVAARLGDGCTAVVLGPASVLTGELRPYSTAERARAGLLTGNVVEAVIRLPGGLLPFRPGYETAIWVMTPARESRVRGWTLLADLSDRELTDDVVAGIAEDVLTWRRDGYLPEAHTRQFCAQVRVSDLVGAPRPLIERLSPSISGFQVDAASRVARMTQLESDLTGIAEQAAVRRQPIHTRATAGAGPRQPPQTIGELVRAGRLVVIKGARIHPTHADAAGQHPVIGAAELTGRARPGGRKIDRARLARVYPRARLTEPGDVVVTTVPRLGTVVDYHGYSVVDFPARILRIPESEKARLTPRVLATLLRTDNHGGRPAQAVRSSRRLEQLSVAMLSPAEVALLDELLEQLDGQLALASQEMDVLTEMRNIAAAGLADGTLTLTGSWPAS